MPSINPLVQEDNNTQDLSRIQSFSDGVFAFAVTLLALSFDVPSKIPASQVATELPKQIYAQYPISLYVAVGLCYF